MRVQNNSAIREFSPEHLLVMHDKAVDLGYTQCMIAPTWVVRSTTPSWDIYDLLVSNKNIIKPLDSQSKDILLICVKSLASEWYRLMNNLTNRERRWYTDDIFSEVVEIVEEIRRGDYSQRRVDQVGVKLRNVPTEFIFENKKFIFFLLLRDFFTLNTTWSKQYSLFMVLHYASVIAGGHSELAKRIDRNAPWWVSCE